MSQAKDKNPKTAIAYEEWREENEQTLHQLRAEWIADGGDKKMPFEAFCVFMFKETKIYRDL